MRTVRVLILNLFTLKLKMHSLLPRVQSLLNIFQNVIDLNTNVLRFAMSEVILTVTRNALCASVFYVSEIHHYALCVRTACNILQSIVNMCCKYRVCIK